MTLISDIVCAYGPGDEPKAHTPLWAVFDPDWYRWRYQASIIEIAGSLPEDDRGLYAFWQRDGARHAHAPNRYFDEMWYRRVHPDVENGIRMGVFDSGFQHYCETGHRGRSCHWLFSESNYFWLNQDLTPALLREMGYSNGFDHYLAVGQSERRVSSCFFSPDVFRSSLVQQRLPLDSGMGDFSRMIDDPDARALRSSWYFDPSWYLETYPEVAEKIASREFASPLHHYLSNDAPTVFSPNPCFDESWYLEAYPDVHDLVRLRGFRNGYDHFVRNGLFEGRSPSEGVSLPATMRAGEAPSWGTLSQNAFLEHVRRLGQEVPKTTVETPHLTQYEQLHAAKVEAMLPLLARTPLDFRYVGRPELSVLISARGGVQPLLTTLASLHEGNTGAMQVILIDDEAGTHSAEIARYTQGIDRVITSEDMLSRRWQRGGARILAPVTLVIEPGAHLYYGALASAMSRLDAHGIIGVAPQCLGPDLRVIEAGLSVSRDGTCLAHAVGAEAFSAETDFLRPCDTVGGGALLCRTEILQAVPMKEDEGGSLRSILHVWAVLGLSLRQAKPEGRIHYDPSFLLRVTTPDDPAAHRRDEEALVLRRLFSDLLRGNPYKGAALRDTVHRSARWGRRVLVLMGEWPVGRECPARIRTLSDVLIDTGAQVTVFSLTGQALSQGAGQDRPGSSLPETVEYRSGSIEQLGGLIERRMRGFDHVWICGGQILNRVFPLINEKAALLPEEGFTLDLRDIEAFGLLNDRRQVGDRPSEQDRALCAEQLDDELRNAWFCQNVVVRDNAQKQGLQEAGLVDLTVLGDWHAPLAGRRYEARRNLLFAAPSATGQSYGLRFLKWFVRDVFPRIEGRVDGAPRLIIGCDGLQSIDLSMMTHYHGVAPLLDGRRPLPSLAAECRVLIVPDDMDGAVASPCSLAAASALPSVQGGMLAQPGVDVSPVVADRFAEAVIRLYQDESAWQQLSDEASAGAAASNARYRETLARLMGQEQVRESTLD
ncbi:hypothetical protein [Asaia sp. VD9]|uniref:hypothetical protein n=1 Tax=Asaia sp. VD9 TaxID=3081235 RepID=UPI00301B2C2B